MIYFSLQKTACLFYFLNPMYAFQTKASNYNNPFAKWVINVVHAFNMIFDIQ